MKKRREVVVDHAQALFLEKGIQQTSIQDIIERAGISKGTFYNYFSSKNECVGAILEQVRYEASLHKSEIQLGKDPTDIDVLIEQSSIISQINHKRGLSRLFEEIMHSADPELKKLVINYRLAELDWFANRLIDVYGIEVEAYAFEASILFYGMQQNIMFISRLTNHRGITSKKVAISVFQYMKDIINHLINGQTALLDPQKLMVFREHFKRDHIELKEVLLLFDELLDSNKLTKPQMDLAVALRDELKNEPIRDAVINALLQPFLESFVGSSLYNQAKVIMGFVWHYQNQ